MAAPVITIADTDVEVAEKLCSFVVEKANAAISESGTFIVGLSGNGCSCHSINVVKTRFVTVNSNTRTQVISTRIF